MKVAIMQPYVFPYIGYFQLIAAVDKFVFLDDVNFINRGWINRNRILINKSPHLFTIPLSRASQNLLIQEVTIHAEIHWKKKLLRKIEFSYKKAPYYSSIYPRLEHLFSLDYKMISSLAMDSIISVCDYLGLSKSFMCSSKLVYNKELKGVERIISICKVLEADTYINPSGASVLYEEKNEAFKQNNLELKLLKLPDVSYSQYTKPFIPFLSIIDVLMFNDIKKVRTFIENYSYKGVGKK